MAGKRGDSLVVEYSSIAPEFEEEYNNWYVTHYLLSRMQAPGVLGAARYQLAGDAHHYLTVFELEGAGALDHPVLQPATDSPDGWDSRVAAQVKVEARLVYNRLLAMGRPGELRAPAMATVRMDVDPAVEDDFNNWYNAEHLPDLGAVAGVQSARRYQQLSAPEGGDWKYLAIYEFEAENVYGSDAWKKAAYTPWTQKILPHIKNGKPQLWRCVFQV